MFQKKPIYITGIVLFTLILLADLALYFLVPTNEGRSNMPDMGGFFDVGSMEEMMPEGFDAESFGSGRPDMGSMDASDAGGERPTMDSSAAMPDRGQLDIVSGNGPLSAIRSAFWPILIVCILGDALCVFMLVRLSRKTGRQEEPEEETEDSRPRRDYMNTCLAVVAVVLVGAVGVSSLPSGRTAVTMEANTSIAQAAAALNDLSSVFSGSGTLLSSDADTVQLPVTVKITSYAVENGDVVQAGDVIATVDKTSVQKAIYEVQSLIEEMDAEIAQVQGDTLDTKLTARAGGRIKAIYVAQGDSVTAAMKEYGAVILMSLGGSMTTVIESNEPVSVGQTLTVTLSDETQIEGKVQQVRNGQITITTTDDGPTPDDTVTVATEDGKHLGTGTLCISSPLKVTGFFGTVDQVKVKVGSKVTSGDTLLTLKDTEDLARYQQLLREREELTELLGALNGMYQKGTIKADTAGIVSQLQEITASSTLSAVSGRTASSASGSYGVTLLSEVTTELPTESTEPSTEGTMPPEADDAVLPEQARDTGTYAGQVTKVTYGVLHIKISETDQTGMTMAQLEAMEESRFTVEKQYSPERNVTVNQYQDGQLTPSSVNEIQAGDKVLLYVEDGTVTQIDFLAGTGVTTPSQDTKPNTNTDTNTNINAQTPSSGGSFSTQSSTEDAETAVYEVEKTTLCTITPIETMTIDILVDELDILSLAPGQEAAITLDALPGQSFSGTVQKLNTTGTNEGGSTKYTVTMEVPRTEQMLDGMNASVRIEVSRLDSVLTVPAAAVYEDGNRTYVYTALDEKSGEPAKAVDVVTGASDGTSIQILSGLSDGDTVYYHYADSIVIRFE